MPTPFEKQLQQYFPDIFALHMLSQEEKDVWELMQQLLKYNSHKTTGKIEIKYDKGRIAGIYVNETITANSHNKPNLNTAQVIDNTRQF